jgi:hypothetical protein
MRTSIGRRLCVLAPCLLVLALSLIACGPSGGATATAGQPEPTPTPSPAGATPSLGLVGRWVIVDYGLELEFAADGRLTQYIMADEHQVEYWTTEGFFRIIGNGWIVIEWANEEPAEFEYLLEEPWLMLRAPDGQVTRYRRMR